MKPTTQLLALFAIAIFAFSCKKSTNKGTLASGVYVVGNIEISNPNDIRPMIWKDGVASQLTNSGWGSANAISIYGADVYVGGFAMLSDSLQHAVVWKNGNIIVQHIPDSTMPASVTSVKAVANGVYACGNYYNHNVGQYYPVYWVNGVMKTLEDSTCLAHAIFVSGNDVYVGGQYSNMLMMDYPVIWKNGKIIFKDSLVSGEINSIFVVGNDIYAAGSQSSSNTVPVLWKNGVATVLNTNGGYASHVFVKNGDVYVTGQMQNSVTFGSMSMVWKNGATTTLAGVGYPANAVASAMKNTDFYTVGNRNDLATSIMILWKNGKDTLLYSGSGTLNDIAVQ